MTGAEPPKGADVLAAVHYVRDFYVNIDRMLKSADEPLGQHDYHWFGRSWRPIPMTSEDAAHPDRWVPHWVIRQYQHKHRKTEVLTVAVLAHDTIESILDEPICLASRLIAKSTASNNIYWVPLLQMRTKQGLVPYGQVQHIRNDDLKPRAGRTKWFQELVKDDELISVAVPLMQISDGSSLMDAVLKPVLNAKFTAKK